MSLCSDDPNDAVRRYNRRNPETNITSSVHIDVCDPAEAALLPARIVSILLDAGFPSLLIERGEIVLSGFVVTADGPGLFRVQWAGTREVNMLPYRRTFLGAYASVLRQAGLSVTYLERDGELYLACQHASRPD